MHSAGAYVVVDAPPPSYDQAIDHPPCSPFGHSNPVAIPTCGLGLSERVVAQSEVIREQEAEIGKLKRDLGKMREQMERMAKGKGEQQQAGGGEPDKLAQRLAVVVGQEAEEKRRKTRSRKGDIIRGSLCCVALLAVLLLGLFIVLSRPSTAAAGQQKPTPPLDTKSDSEVDSRTNGQTDQAAKGITKFRVVGKAFGNNLCWARALVLPNRQFMNCHIFRHSLADRQLFCEFSLQKDKQEPVVREIAGRIRRKGLIVIEDPRSKRRNELSGPSAGQIPNPGHFLLHSLSEEEAMQARRMCTEMPLPRLAMGTTTHQGMMVTGGRGGGGGWRAWTNRRRPEWWPY